MPASVIVTFSTELSHDGKTLTFTETTGVYNALTNLGGWGAPNEVTGDATAATLDILDPSGTTTTLDLFALAGFPSDASGTYAITYDMLGGSADTAFPDGLYVLTYTVTVPGGDSVRTEREVIYFNSEKCVHQMLAKVKVGDCNCTMADLQAACKAFLLLQGLKANACMGNSDRIANFVTNINLLCTNTQCSSC